MSTRPEEMIVLQPRPAKAAGTYSDSKLAKAAGAYSDSKPAKAAGLLALSFAMLAFALAFLTDWSSYLSAPAPKTMVQSATDAATGAAVAVKDRVAGWFVDAPPAVVTPPEVVAAIDWNKRGKGVSVLLAVSAILLATLGFVRHESERMIASALALAGAALAYQFVLKGLVAIAAGLIIAGICARATRRT